MTEYNWAAHKHMVLKWDRKSIALKIPTTPTTQAITKHFTKQNKTIQNIAEQHIGKINSALKTSK